MVTGHSTGTSASTVDIKQRGKKMKKLAILLVVLILSAGISVRGEEDWRGYCQQMATLAENIMAHRQKGTSMSEMMELVGELEIGQTLVIDAYRSPRFSTERMKKEAISDFRDRAYLMCVEVFREK